jgi:predicted DNA repair protein MutK
MPGASLLALLDDIAALLDDVAVMTKLAAQKTAGVLGDDLALNAEQVAGVRAERELPVVWAVAKGSLRNKAILVPSALAISALLPWAVVPLLMLGGAYLCFEGVEKLAHRFLHRKEEDEAEHAAHVRALEDPTVDMVAFERDKVRGAVRTDFILSAEIIVITLGTVAAASFGLRLAVLAGVSLIMTIGVYGLVAGIVKLDDLGSHLCRGRGEGRGARLRRRLGGLILRAAPYLMKGLAIAGTAAMFLVGGGILTHGIPPLHHAIEAASHAVATVPVAGGVLRALVSALLGALSGIVAGALLLALFTGAKRILQKGRGS